MQHSAYPDGFATWKELRELAFQDAMDVARGKQRVAARPRPSDRSSRRPARRGALRPDGRPARAARPVDQRRARGGPGADARLAGRVPAQYADPWPLDRGRAAGAVAPGGVYQRTERPRSRSRRTGSCTASCATPGASIGWTTQPPGEVRRAERRRGDDRCAGGRRATLVPVHRIRSGATPGRRAGRGVAARLRAERGGGRATIRGSDGRGEPSARRWTGSGRRAGDPGGVMTDGAAAPTTSARPGTARRRRCFEPFTALPQQPRVADSVHATLRDAIMAGRLPPGSRLSVPLLAQQLNVSRSPVREAVQRLVQEGLADRGTPPRRGCRSARPRRARAALRDPRGARGAVGPARRAARDRRGTT